MSLLQSPPPTSPLSLIHSIQQNWSLPTSSSVLPSSFLSGIPPTSLPLSLLHALYTLSTLTTNQPDRAYSLLNTYFHARIREGSYRGIQGALIAGLEVSDVEAACESVRRMTKGREMQGVTGEIEEEEVKGKRKYSIRQEKQSGKDDEEDNTRPSKLQKISHGETSSVENKEPNVLPSPSPSPSPSVPTSPIDKEKNEALTTLTPITPRTKRLIHLPPIRTSHITTPVSTSLQLPSAHTSTFTPLFNTLKQEVGYTYVPPPVAYTPYPLYPPHSLNSVSPPTTLPQTHSQTVLSEASQQLQKRQRRLQAAQRATHDFNLVRLHTERLGRAYEDARGRCEDARRRMEDMWWRAGCRG